MYIRCADLHKFWCITAFGDTQFNENSHMRKSVFPWTRICTVLSELPHVEIHKSMCKSAPAEIRLSPCGNSHEIVHFRMWKYTKNCGFPNVRKYSFFWCISTCGNSSGKVNFPHVNLHADSWISTGKNVQEYTIFRGFPHAEIHAEMWIPACGNNAESCITACGNTLNKVQKTSSILGYAGILLLRIN